MKLRNTSNDTVVDFPSGRTAEPDEVITVPDEWADAYEGHPIWEPVPDAPIRSASPAPARPSAATTTNDSTEEDSP